MRLVIEVPDELHARFKAYAAGSGRSQADIVRGWISQWVGEAESRPETPGKGSERPRTPGKGDERQMKKDEFLRRVNQA